MGASDCFIEKNNPHHPQLLLHYWVTHLQRIIARQQGLHNKAKSCTKRLSAWAVG